jgi:hypothetical protein
LYWSEIYPSVKGVWEQSSVETVWTWGKERKEEAGENYLMKRFIISTLQEIVLG